MYQLTNSTTIIRLADNAIIPAELTNIDYQEYLDWVAQGNEPLPHVPPVVEPIPDLLSFLAEFQVPNNPLYLSVFEKVYQSQQSNTLQGALVYDHWTNFKTVIQQQQCDQICQSIQLLSTLLDQAGFSLSQLDKEGWNQLVEKHNLPQDCLLPV